jgi:hypothetical protein
MIGPLGVRAIGHGHRIGRLAADEAAIDGRVVAADGVMDAANDGELVRMPREPRQRLRHAYPRRRRGNRPKGPTHFLDRIRLGIERVRLVGPAHLEEDDARPSPRPPPFAGPCRQDLEQSRAEQADAAQSQKMPARNGHRKAPLRA